MSDDLGARDGDGRAELAERAWRKARAAWPDVDLDLERFAAHLDRVLSTDGYTASSIAALHIDDLYLACGCLHGVVGAHRAFERSIFERVPAMVSHMRLRDEQVDEVRQRTRERLFIAEAGKPPRIAAYGARAALATWVRTSVIRVALNLLESERHHGVPAHDTDDELLALRLAQVAPAGRAAQSASDPELSFIKHRDRTHVRAAFVAALDTLRPDQRNLLRLHHVEGLTQSEIATLARVHKATISRRLSQAEAELVERIRLALSTDLGLPEAEVKSLISLVISQLDLSLSSLLPRRA